MVVTQYSFLYRYFTWGFAAFFICTGVTIVSIIFPLHIFNFYRCWELMYDIDDMTVEEKTDLAIEHEQSKAHLKGAIEDCLQRGQVTNVVVWGGGLLDEAAKNGLQTEEFILSSRPDLKTRIAAYVARYIPRLRPVDDYVFDDAALKRESTMSTLHQIGSGPAYTTSPNEARKYIARVFKHQQAYIYFTDRGGDTNPRVERSSGYTPPIDEGWQNLTGSNLSVPRWDATAGVFKAIDPGSSRNGMVLYIPNVDEVLPMLTSLEGIPGELRRNSGILANTRDIQVQFTTTKTLTTFSGLGNGEQFRAEDAFNYDAPLVGRQIPDAVSAVSHFMTP